MSISSKIGTHVIEVVAKAPNFEMIERLHAKRAPLSPAMFPYYAGTLDSGYGYYDEKGFYIEEEPYLDETLLADEEMSDYDEVYKDELEALNHPSFEDIEKISKLVDETEGTNHVQAKLDNLDKNHEDIHVAKFNDVKPELENKDVKPTISISEPIQAAPTPVPPVPPAPSIIKDNQENSNSYAAKFTTEAKPKGEYYTEVLDKSEDELKKETN